MGIDHSVFLLQVNCNIKCNTLQTAEEEAFNNFRIGCKRQGSNCHCSLLSKRLPTRQ